MLCSTPHKLCLLWSEKAASATAVATFFDYVGFAYDPNKWVHNERVRYEGMGRNVRPQNISDWVVFQVVRNPFSRAVSSYLHCLRFNLNSTASKKKSFLEFVDGLFEKSTDIKYVNHCRRQSNQEGMIPQHIVRIERLYGDIERLHERTGTLLVPHVVNHHACNKFIVRDDGDDRFMGDEFQEELYCAITNRQHNFTAIKNYSCFYNNEIREMVNRKYRQDIIRFGYTFPFKGDVEELPAADLQFPISIV